MFKAGSYLLIVIFLLVTMSLFAVDNFSGTTLSFDGTDDYVTISNESDYDFTNSMTIEVWIKINAFDKYWQAIITKGDDAWRLHRYLSTDNIAFGTSGLSNVDLQGSTNINDGKWHHIAAVYNGSYKYLYVDGKLDASVAVTGTISTNDIPVYIAENGGSTGRYFNGMIDEVRIWNTALDSTQIRENMNLPLSGTETGLVSYYQFNDGGGTILYDAVGSNNGTLTNMTNDDWVTSTIPFGQGYSDTETESNGTVDFTNTGLSMNFNSQNGASITVTRIDTTANVNPGDVDSVLDSQYWIVNRYGTGSFNTDLTFAVNENLTANDETNHSLIKLYTRNVNDDDAWTYLSFASSVDATNNTVTFSGITDFGQFIITKEIVEIDNYAGTTLEFDGTDDYVNCGTGAQITGNNPRTIEAWAYAESFNDGGIFQAGATGTNLADFSLRTLTTDNQWRVQLWGTDMDVTLNDSKNSWHHYCLTYDGTTVKLYYDGTLSGSMDVALNTGNNDIYLGRWQNSYFDGKIDEVRIWNTALDSIQIRENMNLPLSGGETGLITYYQFNDGNGTNLSDGISSNDGTLNNMTNDDWVTSTIPFGPGYADTETETNGTVTFTNTGLSMNFNSQSGASITVARIDTTINNNPDQNYVTLDNQYWVVNRYGSGSFNTDIIFTVDEDITLELEATPEKLRLYKRASTSDSDWSFVKTANSVNAANNTVTFNGISEFGQFVITKEFGDIDNYAGTALEFDGTDDYVNCGTGAQITGNSPRTIEAWAYAQSFNDGGIFQAGTPGTNLTDFSLRTLTTDNQWRVQLWGSDMDVTLNNSKNSWHHYCLTYDGTTIKLYYDGTLSGSMNVALNTGSNDVYFGRWRDDYFNGKIDEVRIWNVALDSTQIRENMNRPLSGAETGLVSYYQFNNGSGTTLSDALSSNDGTLTNMNDNDWITSPIPFGSGYTDTQTETGGTVDFTNTGLSMNFNSQNSASITVTRIDTTANVNPQDVDSVLDRQYWVVNRYGSGSFNADLTFTVDEDITSELETYPGGLQLYNRTSYSTGDWSFVKTANSANAANNTVTFNGITEFGQFIICKGSLPIIAVNPDSLNFGTIEPDGSISLTLTISNTGLDTLKVSSISFTHSFFSSDIQSCNIPPSDNINVTVTFTPLTVVELNEFLIIHSNDLATPEKQISLVAKSVHKIVLLENPQSFPLVTDNFNGIDVGKYSKPTFTDLDGDGLLDLLIGEKDGRIYHYKQDAINSASFNSVTNIFSGIYYGDYSTLAPTFTDLDGDGLLDLLIGEYEGNIGYYEQSAYNSTSFNLITNYFNGIDVGIYATPTITDLDGNGLLDLLSGEGGRNINHYQQDAIHSTSFTFVTQNFNGINYEFYSDFTPTFTDLEGDGLLDLLLGKRDGNLYHYKQNAIHSTSFTLVTQDFNGIDLGDYSRPAPIFIDLDSDGLLDLFLGKADGTINRYEQTACDSFAFGHLLVGNSFTRNYYIKASDLTTNLDIACTGIYQISLSENSGYSQSLSIAPVDGRVSQKVFVRFQPTTEQEYTGTITHTSNGALAKVITITGYGDENTNNYPGTALNFDGTDDYVNCGTDVQITGNNPRTIEAWAYTESFNGGAIFQAGETGTDDKDFSLRTLSTINQWRVQLWGDNNMDVTLDGSIDSWHHYCLTYDGNTVKFYYDGKLSASKDVVLDTGSHDVYFGRCGDDYFDGKIDEVSIWNVALDSTQIRENMNIRLSGTETGLVNYYQFNDGSKATLSEIISGNTGTLINMTDDDWVTSTIPFGSGYADTETEANETVDFTNTGLSMNFNSQTGASVTVARIDTTANLNPEYIDTIYDNQYWVVNRYGTGSFNADLTFTVDENIPSELESDYTRLRLYRRASNSDYKWYFVETADSVNATDNSVIFTGINSFGQFIVCKSSEFISVNSDSLNFGTVEPGDSFSITMTISNTGSDTLEISSITATHSFFSSDTQSCSLSPNDSIDVTITFAPLREIEELNETLFINSNDPYAPEKRIQLVGKAIHKILLLDNPISFNFVTNNFIEIGGDSRDVAPAFTDLDGDGLLDLLIGDVSGVIHHYEQDAINSTSFTLVTYNFNGIDMEWSTKPSPTFTDLYDDGILDMLIGGYNGNLAYYKQDSKNSTSFTLVSDNFNGIDVGIYSAPAFTDLDGDGLLDLLIGNLNGNIFHYEQDAKNSTSFTLVTEYFNDINTGWESNPGPTFTDLDGDGLLDFMVGQGYGNINYYKQDAKNSTSFTLVADFFNGIYTGGHVRSTFTDLDGDGLLDLVIGDWDGNISRYEQSGCDSLAFGHLLTGNSVTKNYYVKASDLSANLNISCTGIYQISLSENSGFSQNISIAPENGVVSDTIFVRFQPTAVQEYTGTITHSSTGADTKVIPIIGYGEQKTDNYSGTALDFNGVNDYVNCGTGSQITGNTPRTIEAWAYTESFNNGAIFELGELGTDDKDFALRTLTSDNQWRVQLWGDDTDFILEGSKNSWHHYCVTYDGTTVKLYYDGELAGSVDVALNTGSSDIYFGRWEKYFFDGKIDEIRIWNVARTEDEIRENMYLPLTGSETGLVSYYQFNDGSGNTLADITGGNAGKLINMTDDNWITSTIPFGPGYYDNEIETNGQVDFSSTGLSMNFNSQNGAEITVTRIDTIANVNPQNVDSVFVNQYWVINRYGTGSFNTDLTFTVSEDLTTNDETNPSNIKLYYRASNANTNWIYLSKADSVNAANKQVTFNEITELGQFILTRKAKVIDNFPGTTLYFDGANDYVNCGKGAQITGSNPRTIEAWAYTEGFNNGGIFQAGATGTNLADFSLRTLTDNNLWRVQLWGNDLNVTLSDSKDSWHHYCLTYDGTTVKFYYDGALSISMDVALNTGSNDFYIGRWQDSYFAGKIDEVRVWNTARSEDEIRENMYLPLTGNETGLVSYYQFNEGEDDQLNDYVSGNVGTLTNMMDDDWVTSLIPFGTGYSDSETETIGTVNFTDTGLSMNLNTTWAGVRITVTRIDTTANITPQDVETAFDNQYWIVNRYANGNGNCNGNLTFTVSEDLTQADETDPSQIALYTRGINSTANWTYLTNANSVNAANNTATFTQELSGFYQFIIARRQQTLDAPQNVTIEISGGNVQLSWDEVTGANSYKIYAADSPNGTFSDVTSQGTFGNNPTLSVNFHTVGKLKETRSQTSSLRRKSINIVNALQKHSRATVTWTAPITEDKKFYYVVASTESGRMVLRNLNKR